MKSMAPFGAGIATAVIVAVIAISGNGAPDAIIASEPGGMDAMSIDMNPHGVPANTATSIGSREFCARINENDVLDADEDEIDTLEIDVTTGPEGIPESNPMIAFSFVLNYLSDYLAIVDADPLVLIASGAGSQSLSLGTPTPDNSGKYMVSAADLNVEAPATESGPGVIARLSIQAEFGISDGLHDLIINAAAHVNRDNEPTRPLRVDHGLFAVNVECPESQPPPAPPPRPANDDFADAILISDLPFNDSRDEPFGNTESATTEPGEPSPCGGVGRTLWYSLTTVEPTLVSVRGSLGVDTVVAVYQGTDLGGLELVACDQTSFEDLGYGLHKVAPVIELQTEQGHTYMIQWGGVDGAFGTGDLWVHDVNAVPPSPTPTTPPPTAVPGGGMDAMSIDMNPHGVPANTATSIGSREFCARINENDFLDADEDRIDALEIDVTTGPDGIPEITGMVAYQAVIFYPEGALLITAEDPDFLLLNNSGSGPISRLSDPLPDADGRFFTRPPT